MTDLKTGCELDATVAENVLGCMVWRRDEALLKAKTQHEYEDVRMLHEFICDCDVSLNVEAPHESEEEGSSQLKHYSTDISEAWLVVETMRKRGFEVYLMGNPGFPWQCRFFNNDQSLAIVRAETAPLAICLAALKAVANG